MPQDNPLIFMEPITLNKLNKKTNVSHQLSVNRRTIRLNQSELWCAYYLVRGKSAKEIARLLQISPRTIEGRLCSLRRKLDCNNRSELIDQFLPKFSFEEFLVWMR